MEKPKDSNSKWYKASLRVFGDGIDIDVVTNHLGHQPSRVGRKGELKYPSPPARQSSNFRWNTSVWILNSPLGDDTPLPQHLNWLLDVLEPNREFVNEMLKEDAIDLFCGFSSENGQGGVTLDPNLLTRLAGIGIPFVLDLYPPGPMIDNSNVD